MSLLMLVAVVSFFVGFGVCKLLNRPHPDGTVFIDDSKDEKTTWTFDVIERDLEKLYQKKNLFFNVKVIK